MIYCELLNYSGDLILNIPKDPLSDLLENK